MAILVFRPTSSERGFPLPRSLPAFALMHFLMMAILMSEVVSQSTYNHPFSDDWRC